ncbi:PSD1 and planctomycete cytochrome C domain-containing protein [Gemmata sp. JC673]|uniref:PSD1 and planctomycete cytochrome C domain-containing protein n=1 Tax=Gemmata algarum TaxID=2975278 RepID=A0ABU5F2X2_9BACT|nr:PSD1 and planctomycete cytochrome C domain-containing protein [Gemmata algarum]MDY3561092.1 PSD1 and planctomycete cytochrome C domain-containing protein [Gemmata algarum]
MRFSYLAPILLVATHAPAFGQSQKEAVDSDHAAKMVKGTELFKASVRNVLQAKCVKCHSGERVEGELDINTRESLLKGGARGPGVVSGDHKKSLLYQLSAHLKEPHMPENGRKLPDADLQKIAEWIDLGAPYDKPFVAVDETAWTRKTVAAADKKHWAYQPLARDIRNPKPDTRNPIDGFLLDTLEKAGLTPNPAADRRTLIRRAYLGLVGLPPTPEQVDAFLKDNSPRAYEKVVDSLLVSPHFGEKQARHWLDLVRFAESHGFEHDYDRPTAYHYRDFVIKALNSDLPFDTFTKWQLAGDEVAPNDPLALMATGYLAAGVHSTQITKNEAEKHRYDELDDILGNIGTTFLGLTTGCARCHDHKYDAIPARDYYRMLSAFTTVVRTEVELDLEPEKYASQKKAFDAAHKRFTDALEQFEREQLPTRFATWEKEQSGKMLSAASWLLPRIGASKSAGGAAITAQPDGSVLLSGKNPTTETLTFELFTDLQGIKALRLEALTHSGLVKNGPGRATNGNFALSDLRVLAEPVEQKEPRPPVRVKLIDPRATFEQKGLPVAAAVDDNATSAWAVDPQFGKDHAAAFTFEKPVGFTGGTKLTVTLSFNNNTGHGIGRPRFAVSASEKPDLTAPATSELVQAALARPAGARTPEQTAALLKWYAPQDAEYRKLQKAERDHLATAPRPNKVKALVASERLPAVKLHTQAEAEFLKETHFLRRGDPTQKNGVAQVSFLQTLMPDAEAQTKWVKPAPAGARLSYQRTAFANWLTDTESGAGNLLARVVVNRLWAQHFGRGLVATVSDFGVRGDAPSHPELLDYLASELVRGGWKLKPIHKLIVTSAAYQQSSVRDEAKVKLDPENKLVWRQPVRRLQAEVIRDSILAAGGRLNTTMYGPGTLSEESTRRSVYFTMKRSKLIPALVVFDAPDGTVGVGDRPNTTVAPQSLHLMNNPHVRAAAYGLAVRAANGGKASDPDSIANAYQIALCRAPTKDELTDGIAFLKGATGADREAKLADLCQVLFCLNEFLYVE